MSLLGCRHCSKHYSLCDCPASVQRKEPLMPLPFGDNLRPMPQVPREPMIDPRPAMRKHADEIRMEILRIVCNNERWAELMDLACERAWSIGAKEYGNASYSKSDNELRHEGDCEISDLIFYLHIPIERESWS